MALRNVVSTLNNEGKEVMGPNVLLYHVPSDGIANGTLLTVESNHFCVLKSRGAILNVYETGQYQVETPQHPLFGSIQTAFYGGQNPWQYEAIYLNRAKLVCTTQGQALSKEMAEMEYSVDYYIHVDTGEDAVNVVQHMPYAGHFITTENVNAYAGPVIEQAINQIVQCTPLEQVNEKIQEITEAVHEKLATFLKEFGIHLNSVKVLVRPSDELMKSLISLKAFGLSEIDAVRYYCALEMAKRGVISAPNMACGEGFNITGGSPMLNVPMTSAPAQGGNGKRPTESA